MQTYQQRFPHPFLARMAFTSGLVSLPVWCHFRSGVFLGLGSFLSESHLLFLVNSNLTSGLVSLPTWHPSWFIFANVKFAHLLDWIRFGLAITSGLISMWIALSSGLKWTAGLEAFADWFHARMGTTSGLKSKWGWVDFRFDITTG